MQVSWQYLLVGALFSTVYGQLETKDVRSISSGTSFGMCRGYCRQSINVTSIPLQLTSLKEANFPQNTYPTVTRLYPFSSTQWTQLVSLFDAKVFSALDDTIGCPDCADGGAEWIEVNWAKGTKRVTFENRRDVKGIEALITQLRKMREQYLN